MIYLAIIIFILLILLITIVFMVLLLWAALFTKVPFIPVDKKILPAIVEAMQINKEYELYPLVNITTLIQKLKNNNVLSLNLPSKNVKNK